jgi:hypothetical protein
MAMVSAQAAPPNKNPPSSAQPATYFDANGKAVGPSINNGSLLLRLADIAVGVALDTFEGTGLATWNIQETVYFDETACAGRAFVGYNTQFFGVPGRAQVNKRPDTGQYTLYLARTSRAPETLTLVSQLRAGGVCEELTPTFTASVHLADVYDISGFAPPFTLK